MDTKIFLGIPTNRGIKGISAESIFKMIAFKPELFLGFNVATEGYTVAENRNCLVARAIKSKATHILFIDDDMIVPEDTAVRLLAHKQEIVGITYHPRQMNSEAMLKKINAEKMMPVDYNEPPLVECEGVGGGVLFINLDVFKKIERPWFDWKIYDTGMVKMGEDFYFCEKAREAGYQVWADTTLKVGHIGDFVY